MTVEPTPQKDLRDEEERRRFLASLPRKPGVYIMKGYQGAVLYIGKANDLFSRVNSYFRPSGDDRYFISRLPRVLRSMEIIIVESEREALLLENNLIKEMKPRYNVLLRDDKSYMSIRLDKKHPYPRFVQVRGTPREDGALYFGPYHSARSVRSVISFVNRHFLFRTCNDRKFASRKRPCLQYHIKRCEGPCVLEVSQKSYRHRIDEAVMFLRGEKEKLVNSLRHRMEEASRLLLFEEAAVVRDLLISLEKIAQPQNVVQGDQTPMDIMGYAKEGDKAALVIMEMRRGMISTHRQTMVETLDIPDEELVESYIVQHYLALKAMPEKVIIPFDLPSGGAIAELLTERAEHTVELIRDDDQFSKLLGLAHASARSRMTLMGELDVEEQLKTLSVKLKMQRLPQVMECYDISHLQGNWAVGSMVVF
ncbi:excinuclease ABC subunit UvrC, partial [Myxococcota bacterium]|nr:excinuclease ABC subunit UvrC [Myxococcota bacterium]